MVDIKIHEATKRDFSELVKMGLMFWHKRTTKEIESEFKRIFSSKREKVFICRDDNDYSVGFVNVSIRSDYVEGSKFSPHKTGVGYLESIYIKKEYRKKGIAKQLVKKAEKWFSEKGVSEIGSDVELNNAPSQRFHEKIGFKKGETLVHYLKKL